MSDFSFFVISDSKAVALFLGSGHPKEGNMATIEERVSKSGEKHYRVKIRLSGYLSVSQSFTRKTDAHKWSQKMETGIREGRMFGMTRSASSSLSEAVDRYLQHVRNVNPRRLEDIEVFMMWWKDRLGTRLLSSLTRADFAACREILLTEEIIRGRFKKRRSNATVNRYMSAVRTMLKLAVDEWQCIDKNPIKKLRDLPESKGRNRYLSKEEFDALLIACKASSSSYLYAIVIIAVSCGARKSEVNCTKWADVHLDRQMIVLSKTKNKESRVIYLHGPGLAEVERLHAAKKKGGQVLIEAAIDAYVLIYGLKGTLKEDLLALISSQFDLIHSERQNACKSAGLIP